MECPLMTHSRHSACASGCPLLGVKRTWAGAVQMSAFDPKRKSAMLCNQLTRSRQLRSTTCSSFLLNIQERPRNTTSITKPMPEEASLMSFSETWPKE